MRPLIFLGLLTVAAAPVVARSHSEEVKDPNKVICRVDDMTGSRLQTKKTCLTAQQWDDLEQQQRHAVEKIQANRPHSG